MKLVEYSINNELEGTFVLSDPVQEGRLEVQIKSESEPIEITKLESKSFKINLKKYKHRNILLYLKPRGLEKILLSKIYVKSTQQYTYYNAIFDNLNKRNYIDDLNKEIKEVIKYVES